MPAVPRLNFRLPKPKASYPQRAEEAMTSRDGPYTLTVVLALLMVKPQQDEVLSHDLTMEELILCLVRSSPPRLILPSLVLELTPTTLLKCRARLPVMRYTFALSLRRWGPMTRTCDGGGDVVGVVTPLVGGVAEAFHGDQVVELRVQLAVQEAEGKKEDREGQEEVEEEKRLKEVRSWMTMEMK